MESTQPGPPVITRELVGREVVDMDGSSIGEIEQIFSHDEGNSSDWAAVKSGLVDTKRLAVPLADASMDDDKVVVPYPKEMITSGPELEEGGFSEAVEMDAYRHYNLRRELGEAFRTEADLSDPPPAPDSQQDAIAARAYEIYELRGREDGRHEDDWYAAEAEMRDPPVEGRPPAPSDGRQQPPPSGLTPDNGAE